MIYAGGLTFDSGDPAKLIEIPNLIEALFDRLRIYHSMETALQTLSATGAPDQVLGIS